MIEIFSHGISVHADEDESEVLIVSGKGWENEPFNLYIREDEAHVLLWQLNFFLNNWNAPADVEGHDDIA